MPTYLSSVKPPSIGLILLAVLAVVFPAVQAGRAAQPNPPPNVLIAKDRTEPVIAINPRDPLNFVGGSNPNYDVAVSGGFPASAFSSHDGGKTWSVSTVPLRAPYTTASDPSVAFDRHGTAFFVYFGMASSYCSTGSSAVLIARSHDGGRHFGQLVTVDNSPGFHDKPYLAVQSFAHRPDHIFIVWDRWQTNTIQLLLQRSVDGGWHFSPPALLAQSTWLNFGAMPVVGPHGRITVIWAQFPPNGGTNPLREQILARTSYDDGVHWGPIVSVSHGYFWGMPNMVLPGQLRVFDIPSITVTKQGLLYAAWTVVRVHQAWGGVLSDIVVSRSHDGVHWSPTVRVNDSLAGDRFMPTVSALPDGSVGVAFYDRRTNHQDFNVYAARVFSVNGKLQASSNIRLNAGRAPTNNIYYIQGNSCLEPGRFFGDYISSVADPHGNFHVIWADTQRQANGQTDIWTASVKLAPPATHSPHRVSAHHPHSTSR
jgi:hypothetical protein